MTWRRPAGIAAALACTCGLFASACHSGSSDGVVGAGTAHCGNAGAASSTSTSVSPASSPSNGFPLVCTISDPTAGFIVSLPGAPAKTTKATTAVDGTPVTIVNYQWSNKDNSTVFDVSYEDFPSSMQQDLATDPKSFFDTVTDSYVSSISPSGSPPTSAVPTINVGTFQARPEQTVGISEGAASLQLMMFVNENFLMILSVASPVKDVAAQGIAAMSGSFTFSD